MISWDMFFAFNLARNDCSSIKFISYSGGGIKKFNYKFIFKMAIKLKLDIRNNFIMTLTAILHTKIDCSKVEPKHLPRSHNSYLCVECKKAFH